MPRPALEGDVGISRYVPMFYGQDFTKHLNNLIDSEIEKFAKAAEEQSPRTADKKSPL